jgi:hypothetical protein
MSDSCMFTLMAAIIDSVSGCALSYSGAPVRATLSGVRIELELIPYILLGRLHGVTEN